FFRAIEAQPEDDTPRLVYADWLDEHAASDVDRARADLIRVQCWREREPPGERRVALAGREGGLLVLYGREWVKPLPGDLNDALTDFRRGFLDPVTLPAAGFASHAKHLSEQAPLFHVRLVRARDAMKAIAARPELSFVRRLTLAGAWVQNAELTALAPAPHLDNLQQLDLSHNQIGIRGATDLATARAPALRELRLERNPIKDRGLLALAQADWPALEHLDATECGLRFAPAGLADGPLVRRLVSLQLSRNPDVPASAWLRLAAAPWGRLERLDLSNPTVTDAVAEALAANPALAGLRVLHLGAATITARGARAILASPYLRGLTRLRLPDDHLDPALRAQLRAVYGAGLNPRS
ncbi:MAG: TIGR02996 domain-containing protein, partial [Planctomycetes bacterium]|nr:TIGR02996 domain-containing protein [Planctomycetota bacterium]